MKLSNCNCGKEIQCNCQVLTFDSYNANATSVLEVGNLVGLGCSLQEYVIDWYRDGKLALVTGKGLDPDIQAFHPALGNAAIPVIGGTYVPVVRYVVIDGIQLFLQPLPCRRWCNIQADLPSITVARLHCGSTNRTGSYQYQIIYSSSDPTSLPSRTITWDLPEDGSVKHFAVMFTGYDIADKVEVFYKDEDHLMTSWAIGQDALTKYGSLPYERRYHLSHSFVVALPPCQPGDFLIIRVTPSVKTGIPQTNWELNLKCLTTQQFDCSFINPNLREYDLSSWSFEDVPASCHRRFRINMVNLIPYFWSSQNVHYPLHLYAGVNRTSHQSIQIYSYNNPTAQVTLTYTKTAVTQSLALPGYSQRATTTGKVNLTKNGNVLVYTCDNIADFETIYNNYQLALNSVWYTNQSNDPADPRYYRFWSFVWRSRPANCGDTALNGYTLYFHISSPVVFDPVSKKITITMLSVTNQYSNEPCNSLVSSINNYINNTNGFIARADFSEDTLCFEYRPFGYGAGWTGWRANVSTSNFGGYSVSSEGDTTPCGRMAGWCTPDNSTWRFYVFLLGIVITLDKDPDTGDFPTNASGQYLRDPLENFILYDMVNPQTGCVVSIPHQGTKVLELRDGAQIFP